MFGTLVHIYDLAGYIFDSCIDLIQKVFRLSFSFFTHNQLNHGSFLLGFNSCNLTKNFLVHALIIVYLNKKYKQNSKNLGINLHQQSIHVLIQYRVCLLYTSLCPGSAAFVSEAIHKNHGPGSGPFLIPRPFLI